jgi:1-deoxy-D-xylulose-5-phosphate synthase
MLVHMLHTAIAHDGPAALRYPRGAAEGVEIPAAPKLIPIGVGEILSEGRTVALLGYGYGVHVALEAAAILADHGIQVTVADPRFAKPLDEELTTRLARDHDLLVTIEENVLPGGFGAGVLEFLEDSFEGGPAERARVLRVGLPDRYVTHGKPDLLRAEVGLTGQSVADRVLAATPSAQPIAR